MQDMTTAKETILSQYLETKDGSGTQPAFIGLDNPSWQPLDMGALWDGEAPLNNLTNVGLLCEMIWSAGDISQNIQNFYNIAWNIDTAQGVWLDNWGAWVGISRQLTVPATNKYIGFSGQNLKNFNNGSFYDKTSTANTYSLSDDIYRQLILLKAFSNISDCSIPTLNKCLAQFFAGRGYCYAINNFDMSITLTFEFALKPYEISILTLTNAFPRPSGVKINIKIFNHKMFGFKGQNMKNFNNSYF